MTIAGLTVPAMPALRGIRLRRKVRPGTATSHGGGRPPIVKDLRPIPVCGSSIRPLAEQRRRALSDHD